MMQMGPGESIKNLSEIFSISDETISMLNCYYFAKRVAIVMLKITFNWKRERESYPSISNHNHHISREELHQVECKVDNWPATLAAQVQSHLMTIRAPPNHPHFRKLQLFGVKFIWRYSFTLLSATFSVLIALPSTSHRTSSADSGGSFFGWVLAPRWSVQILICWWWGVEIAKRIPN